MPESVDAIYLERCIVNSGSGMVVWDNVLEKALSGGNASTGNLDIYGFPLNRRIIFRNGQEARYDVADSVIVYGNSQRASDLWIFQYFADRMANADGAVDVNINSQKTMPIIPTTQDQQLTIENLYNDIISNIPYALVEQDTVNVDALKNALQFDNRKSFTSDLITATQREIWNRFLTFIGVNNVNIEKKERTNVPEIDSNLDEIYIMRRDRLNCREQAAEVMNRKFGWDVEVDYYHKIGEGGAYGALYGGSADDLRTDVSESTPGSEY